MREGEERERLDVGRGDFGLIGKAEEHRASCKRDPAWARELDWGFLLGQWKALGEWAAG